MRKRSGRSPPVGELFRRGLPVCLRRGAHSPARVSITDSKSAIDIFAKGVKKPPVPGHRWHSRADSIWRGRGPFKPPPKGVFLTGGMVSPPWRPDRGFCARSIVALAAAAFSVRFALSQLWAIRAQPYPALVFAHAWPSPCGKWPRAARSAPTRFHSLSPPANRTPG